VKSCCGQERPFQTKDERKQKVRELGGPAWLKNERGGSLGHRERKRGGFPSGVGEGKKKENQLTNREKARRDGKNTN